MDVGSDSQCMMPRKKKELISKFSRIAMVGWSLLCGVIACLTAYANASSTPDDVGLDYILSFWGMIWLPPFIGLFVLDKMAKKMDEEERPPQP